MIIDNWKTDISDKNNDDTTRIMGFKILTALLCFLVRDTVSSVQRYQNIITVEDALTIAYFINPLNTELNPIYP